MTTLLLVPFPTIAWFIFIITEHGIRAFSTTTTGVTPTTTSKTVLHAAPKRLDENVDGVLFVNSACINCAACSHFAPDIFKRSPSDGYHVVYKQPSIDDEDQVDRARAALSACPVAAIRAQSSAQLNHANKVAGGTGERLSPEDETLAKNLAISPKVNGLKMPFPRPVLTDTATGVFFLGNHNDKSFGATPYLAKGQFKGTTVAVMIDTPRFTKKSMKTVQSLLDEGSAPDFLFLTHVDDTADHLKWSNEFPSLKRIFHSGDLGPHNWLGDTTLENVEVLLEGNEKDGNQETSLQAWNLDGEPFQFSLDAAIEWPEEAMGDFFIIHTPGHSPGSISLLFRSTETGINTIFTGDTYSYSTRDGGHMSGFPRYGNDLRTQSETIRKIGKMSQLYDVVAPGHGHKREYMSIKGDENQTQKKQEDIETAVEELAKY